MKPRKIFQKLLKQKNSRKVSLLIGPRQVGKTTLLKAAYDNLYNEETNALFLDLDIFSNYEKVSTFESLIKTIELNGYDKNQKEFFYLFLDEFQRYPNLTMIMKNVYDTFDNVKIYASGSSSISIKDTVQESLAGRKILNYIYPLDFEEFLWFKEDKNAITNLKNIGKLKGKDLIKPTQELFRYLSEFLVYGGYPEVVIKTNKKDVLESIFDLFVKKDLVDYLKIDKIVNVKRLIEYLAVNNGQKIKYNEAAQSCSLSYKEVKNYVELLVESYLIVEVRPFYKNKNTELVKIPKIYYIDNGVRNYFINNFNQIGKRGEAGFLFEGYVISELVKSGTNIIKFWQDKNKHEVDIILDFISKRIPIEVKFKQTLKKRDYNGLNLYNNLYLKTTKGYIINLNQVGKKGKIRLILPYDLSVLSS